MTIKNYSKQCLMISAGIMVLALLLSLAMIRIEKELPKEMRPK